MMHDLPTITLVTPSFNQARYLERTILSVLSQQYPKLEYIIMDGGSEDASSEIIKKYECRLAHWESQKDGGQGAAIIKGWKLGTGKLIGWLNSDDILLSGALHRLGRLFTSGKYDIVTGETLCIDEDDFIESYILQWRGPSWMYKAALLHPGQPGTFYARKSVEDVGYFDCRLCCAMEFDLVMKMLRVGARIGSVSYIVAALRHHSETKSRQMDEIFRSENRTVFAKYASYPFHNAALRELTVKMLRYPYMLRYLSPLRFAETKKKIEWILRRTKVDFAR